MPVRRAAAALLATLPAALLAVVPGITHAAPVSYTVDPVHTTVYFSATHFDRSSVRGRFGKVDGRVIYDEETGAGALDFAVDASSVDTGNRTLDGVLRSAQFLHAAEFPVVRLRANRFIVEDGRLVAVDGDLTLLDVTRPLRLQAERFRCGDATFMGITRHVCGGDFRATFVRSEFGMRRFLPEVGDTVTLLISVEASPGPAAASSSSPSAAP